MPRAEGPTIDGLELVSCGPEDPHYPESGHAIVDGPKVYVRDDEIEKILAELRKLSK